MSAAELLEQIVELRETIGSNPHPDDFVGEREDLAALEAQYRAVTTESQRKAVDGEGGGMFTPHVDGDEVSFATPEGDRLPFTIWAGWSSTSVGLPLVTVDTENDLESPAGPVLRISLNDELIYEPEAASEPPAAATGQNRGDVDWCQAENASRVFDGERCTSCGADWQTGEVPPTA